MSEVGLSTQFWREALAALVYVLNRIPTISMPHTTLFEVWFKHKPDGSNLHMWGCLAYVHVQNDKHGALGSHTEKCIVFSYPLDYKGWEFYNTDIKQIIIFECAVLDKHYFSGLKNWPSVPFYCIVPFSPPIDTALNPPLDDNPLLTMSELSLPHLEREEPAPGRADVPVLPVIPEQVQADSLATLPALTTPVASLQGISCAAQPASHSHPPLAPDSTCSEPACTQRRVQSSTNETAPSDH
jgi:hypothetical protein